MKKILFLVFLLFSSNLFYLFSQQYYYTFSELKGMEDSNNNTHLFYRLYTFQKGGSIIGDYYENSIYHLDFENEKDTLFLFDGGRLGDFTNSIVDLEFWDTDPSKFIYLGVGISVDPVAYIRRFDQPEHSYFELGEAFGLELGKQNDSLVIASAPALIKSTDGGFNWTTFTDSTYFIIISISPYSENEMFFTAYGESLYRTMDGGTTINLVDTVHFFAPQLFYDKDSIHIYNKTNNSLKVSDNRGNAFSWIERYLSSNPIYLTIDYSQSGSIYLADGRYIYHSTDYGLTFTEYKVLDRKIVGIYKKPGSDKLYASTKYNLYEIITDSIKVIKSLQSDPDLATYYPLAIENKWVYDETVCYIDFPPVPCNFYSNIVEVIGDTVLSNGFNYYVLKETNAYSTIINFERYNPEDATVRRYAEDSSLKNNEFIIEDFLTDVGDTSCTSRFGGYNCYAPKIFLSETSDYVFGLYRPSKKYEVQDLDWHRYSLVKGFGIDSISYGFDFGYGTVKLKGCVINGVLYGDTTVVGINDPDNTPREFLLFQNYPNPFNPSTKIKFVIPQSSFVNLIVYDVLGREVATLVSEEKPAGEYEVEFNGDNFPSGVYIYHIKAGKFSQAKKLILMK